jgi:RimJ/RimL family protein N-acetyltransferase
LAAGLLSQTPVTHLPRHATTALDHVRKGKSTGVLAPTVEWSTSLPQLRGQLVSLRELAATDAIALHALLTTSAVDRLISPPPASADAFERFIATMRQSREAGTCACFGIVPAGAAAAVGLIQIRQLEPSFRTAEWGFALGSAYWGNGMFMEAATLALEFIFERIGVERLEARAALINGRGNGVLRKLGAVQELVLRRSFLSDGRYLDQALWTMLAIEWRESRTVAGAHTPVH